MRNFNIKKFIFRTIDPVHIGTGGTQLGRVDNSIIREIGTNIPKIPGTSLMGAARAYIEMQISPPKKKNETYENMSNDRKSFFYTFGFAVEEENGISMAGTVNISDARIFFFPVYSPDKGPVWITTKKRMNNVKEGLNKSDTEEEIEYFEQNDYAGESINLGWMVLNFEKTVSFKSAELKEKVSEIYVVNEKIFSQLVNSNLEVRTSVAINPETGAAKEGALFTYEAIPRETWLYCDVIENDYHSDKFPIENKSPMDFVEAGFGYFEYLGVGGMTTRGFGRMKKEKQFDVQINGSVK